MIAPANPLAEEVSILAQSYGLPESLDRKRINQLIEARDYEELDWVILSSLMGK